jgi:hypothetical protein
MKSVTFGKVLDLFESNGWALQKSLGKNRIFTPNDGSEGLWSIPVNDKKVNILYYRKIKEFFENETEDT